MTREMATDDEPLSLPSEKTLTFCDDDIMEQNFRILCYEFLLRKLTTLFP